MFPLVNQIFRKKNLAEINTLKIAQTDYNFLTEANIDPNNLHKNDSGNYLITNLNDKLEIIGTHFAKINTQNKNLGNKQFNNVIEKTLSPLREEMLSDQNEGKIICIFKPKNNSDNPKVSNVLIDYFTDFKSVEKKFRSLNNKKSYGFDKIPNIVLKHIPKKNYILLHNFIWQLIEYNTLSVSLEKSQNNSTPQDKQR